MLLHQPAHQAAAVPLSFSPATQHCTDQTMSHFQELQLSFLPVSVWLDCGLKSLQLQEVYAPQAGLCPAQAVRPMHLTCTLTH